MCPCWFRAPTGVRNKKKQRLEINKHKHQKAMIALSFLIEHKSVCYFRIGFYVLGTLLVSVVSDYKTTAPSRNLQLSFLKQSFSRIMVDEYVRPYVTDSLYP